MEKLWAPWRMEYILSDKSGECIFCQALMQEDPQTAYILHRNETGFVIMNIYPYNSGHLMVVPCRHVAELEKLTQEEQSELMKLVTLSTKVLKQALQPQGLNIGMNLGREAGAGIETHLHWHVVPRWSGDTNFMPILAETKVISQHVADTYHQLKPLFSNQKG
jgi:ATP adenylyltransferase